MAMNKQFILAARPTGYPKETDFTLVESLIPTLGPGQVLLRTLYLSLDPYMRGRMNEAKSYSPPQPLGEVMQGETVSQVVESNHSCFQRADIVTSKSGWQEHALSDGTGLRKVDPSLAPISTAVGILGMPGLTAYFGLLNVGNLQPGESVVVSGAAGAVGTVVGQIAKIKGCRVVGIAGSDDKIRYLVEELGFDAGFNYKTETDYVAKLKELCPQGVDVYFDNVGGSITDAVFQVLNIRARIAVCGQSALYNLEQPELGPRLQPLFIAKRLRMEGFLSFDFAERADEALRQMAEWLQQGKLKYQEDIALGIENAPRAFIDMLKGQNKGKQLVKMADPV